MHGFRLFTRVGGPRDTWVCVCVCGEGGGGSEGYFWYFYYENLRNLDPHMQVDFFFQLSINHHSLIDIEDGYFFKVE